MVLNLSHKLRKLKLLNSIDKKKEIYHFINEAIYKAVVELKLLSYFDGKLEKPKKL